MLNRITSWFYTWRKEHPVLSFWGFIALWLGGVVALSICLFFVVGKALSLWMWGLVILGLISYTLYDMYRAKRGGDGSHFILLAGPAGIVMIIIWIIRACMK